MMSIALFCMVPVFAGAAEGFRNCKNESEKMQNALAKSQILCYANSEKGQIISSLDGRPNYQGKEVQR